MNIIQKKRDAVPEGASLEGVGPRLSSDAHNITGCDQAQSCPFADFDIDVVGDVILTGTDRSVSGARVSGIDFGDQIMVTISLYEVQGIFCKNEHFDLLSCSLQLFILYTFL